MRRASSAPMNDKCPASAYGAEDNVRINRIDDAGIFGTAVHEAAACIVQELDFNPAELLARYRIAESETGRFYHALYAINEWWQEFGAGFIADDDTLRVLDWKTTRLADVDYLPQTMEYLWLGLKLNSISIGLPPGLLVEQEFVHLGLSGHPDLMFVPPEAKQCQSIIVYLEDGSQDVSPILMPVDVVHYHEALEHKLLEWDGRTYNPSGACWYCHRCAVCPAIRHEIAQMSFPMVEDLQEAITALDDSACVDMWDRLGMAIKFLERARECIKLRAVGSGMTLVGEGHDLVIEERKQHPLKAMEAWPILTKYLTDKELAPAVSVSKTIALAAISAKVERGQKKAFVAKVTAELEAAGALEDKTILFSRIVPSPAASNRTLPAEGA